MHFAGTMSWQIREGIDHNLAMALYVRDAAGLEPYVVTEPDVSVLDPPVPTHVATGGGDSSAQAMTDLRLAVREWPTWWTRALQQVSATTPQEAQEAGPPAPPEWRGLQDLPTMRALAQLHHPDFWRWLDAPKHTERERQRGQHGGSDPLHLTHLVNGYERRLGRPVRPFTLHLRLLPLQQSVGWVLDEQQILLSTRLREDAAAMERLLEPVILALA
ncbi:hypothetical protein [Kineococcus sp. R86509]|uniref:hypothetical protein n=1 Tax=Kineococcus sp. R86509 TaxID=3093851 RepID=UPI0036D2952B